MFSFSIGAASEIVSGWPPKIWINGWVSKQSLAPFSTTIYFVSLISSGITSLHNSSSSSFNIDQGDKAQSKLTESESERA